MKKYIISYIINYTILVLNVEVEATNSCNAISSITDDYDSSDHIIISSCIPLKQ